MHFGTKLWCIFIIENHWCYQWRISSLPSPKRVPKLHKLIEKRYQLSCSDVEARIHLREGCISPALFPHRDKWKFTALGKVSHAIAARKICVSLLLPFLSVPIPNASEKRARISSRGTFCEGRLSDHAQKNGSLTDVERDARPHSRLQGVSSCTGERTGKGEEDEKVEEKEEKGGSVCATCVITLAITPTHSALPSLGDSNRGSRLPRPFNPPTSSDGGRVVTRY